MARYRIVVDGYAGYEAQVWRWWWPFWTQIGFCNTHPTVSRARLFIERHRNRVVEYVS